MLVLSTLSLYVSSLSGSAVRAMVTSIPVRVGAGALREGDGRLVSRVAFRAVSSPTGQSREVQVATMMSVQTRTEYALVLAVVVMVVLLLRFAFVNHRSDDRRHSRTLAQAAVLFAAVTLCLALAAPDLAIAAGPGSGRRLGPGTSGGQSLR